MSTSAARLTLPDEVALAAGQRYHWRVEARTRSGASYRAEGTFTLAEPSTLAAIERARPGAGASFSERVLYAAYLERIGLYAAAGQWWQALARERPDLPLPRSVSR